MIIDTALRTPSFTPKTPGPSAAPNGAAFADALTKAAGLDRNYASMTPNQMKSAAKTLFDQGKIDLHQMGMLQMAGPLGKVGPNGQFVPFTPAEQARIDNTPVNYIQLTKDAIAGIESRGEAANRTSGYRDWKHLSTVLTQQQGVR